MKKVKSAVEDIQIRGFRVKLLPTPKQEQLFWQFAGTRRYAYNWALERRTNAWVNDGIYIPTSQLQHEFTLLRKEDNTLWLNDISCDVGKQAIKDLDTAFTRYFEKTKELGYVTYTKNKIMDAQRNHKELTVYDRNGYPKFKKKLNCNEGFHQDCCSVQFKDDKVHIAKIGWVKLSNNTIFPQGHSRYDFNLYNAKVKTDGINWYFVAGLQTEKKDTSKITKSEPIGLDLGIKDLAILSDGTKYKNINKTYEVKQLEKRIKRLQRKVSKKYEMNKEGDKYVKTNNIIKEGKQLMKLQHRLKNIRTNYRHQVTSEIIKREPIFICMEDLNVFEMMKNKHLSKAIQNQGFGYMRTYLTYKCEEHDIPLYFTDRWYPSSKTCSCCGFINKNLKLSDRIYNCPNCNISIDRDINAAINIRNYGQELYNKSINQAS